MRYIPRRLGAFLTVLVGALVQPVADGVEPADPRAPASPVRAVEAPAEAESESPEREAPSPPPPAPPPIPEIEELPARNSTPEPGPKSPGPRRLFDLGPEDRPPAGHAGGSFFDPGKLAGGATSNGVVTVRGYVGTAFIVTERTNLRQRDAAGRFEKAGTSPYFGGGTATLYFGAPVYSDVVYARIALEYISIPVPLPGTRDVIPAANRRLLMEAAAIEVNPFASARRLPTWFRYGFKVTTGAFVVPFGIEDAEHAAPVNWFGGRPTSMSNGRIYPGTWTDLGAYVTWKPTFGHAKPLRPIQIDVGAINGDACTQTRFADYLYRGGVASAVEDCERRLRPEERDDGSGFEGGGGVRADGGFLGLAPSTSVSVVTRLRLFPLPAIEFGGSYVRGTHPGAGEVVDSAGGETVADLDRAETWRVGGHAQINFEEIFQSRVPLPHLRAEVVYGVDAAVKGSTTHTHRRMIGGYAQIAQQLFRRKNTRLPGLIVQYRFDHTHPDLDVPGIVGGVALASNFADGFRYDEAVAAHTVGLRFPVVPRFILKADYTFQRENGGSENQLSNDLFVLQAVADF